MTMITREACRFCGHAPHTHTRAGVCVLCDRADPEGPCSEKRVAARVVAATKPETDNI